MTPREHVIVTGAAGFIGSHLSRRLRGDGYRVVGVDDGRGVPTKALAERRLDGLRSDPGFDLVEADVASTAFARAAAGARAVFHFAGRPGARDGHGPALLRENVRATAAVIEAAAAAGVANLVFASSSSVYGEAGARRACRERDAATPLSRYGETKLAAELLCVRSSLRSRIVRLFTVYGPYQRPDMAFARFIRCSLTGGAAPLYQPLGVTRDFTYVDDAIEGTLRAWRRGVAPIYNISGGRAIDLASACRTIEELTGARIETRVARAPWQPSMTRADLSISRSDLGYRPSVELRAGLEQQIAVERVSPRRAEHHLRCEGEQAAPGGDAVRATGSAPAPRPSSSPAHRA